MLDDDQIAVALHAVSDEKHLTGARGNNDAADLAADVQTLAVLGEIREDRTAGGPNELRAGHRRLNRLRRLNRSRSLLRGFARRIRERRLFRGRAPLLGICLGAQYMAAAMGARVYPGPAREIGWGTVTLTRQDSVLAPLASAPVLHWHGDTFDLPEGATLLASSSLTPHQAFSLAPGQLALQFHMEADSARMESWLVGHCCELSMAGIDPCTLREDARRLGQAAREAGMAVCRNWLAECRSVLQR